MISAPAPDTEEAAAREAQAALVAAAPHPFRIKDRVFPVEEMYSLNMILFIDALISEVDSLLNSGKITLDELQGLELSRDNLTSVPKIIQLIAFFWKRAPGMLSKMLALCLNEDDPEVGEWVLKNSKPTQLFDLVEALMRVNAWGDLVSRFFRLVAPIRAQVAAYQQTTPSLSSTSAPSLPEPAMVPSPNVP